MNKIIELLLMGFAAATKDRPLHECIKCGMAEGGGFCSRFMHGELDACQFKPASGSTKC